MQVFDEIKVGICNYIIYIHVLGEPALYVLRESQSRQATAFR